MHSWFLLVTALLGEKTTSQAPPLTLNFDYSMVPTCRKVLARDAQAVVELADHPTVRLLSHGMQPGATFTSQEFAEASRSTAPDARFSWKQFRERADEFEQLSAWIQQHESTIRVESQRQATRYIGALPTTTLCAHFTCGAAWDAFVLIVDDQPHLFLDLGLLGQSDQPRAQSNFQNILTHELWHAALSLQLQELGWPNYRDAQNRATKLAYVMLNEGGGHFYSLKTRLKDPNSKAETESKFQSAFSLLAQKYPRYASSEDAQEVREILWGSHAGVPFWEKWSAVPGAYVFHRLSQALGDAELGKIVSTGPYEFVFRYAELQKKNRHWPAMPAQFLADLQQASRIDLRLDSRQARAVLALARLGQKGEVTSEAWPTLLQTEAYQRLKQREAAFQRSFTDDDFKSFVMSDQIAPHSEVLSAALSRWKEVDLHGAAEKALSYLPPEARIHATVYLVIKPKTNSFVWEIETRPALFLYVDPAKSPQQIENLLVHEIASFRPVNSSGAPSKCR